MRLPDPGRMLGLPGSLARPLARRVHEVNAIMDGVAERFGTLHYDAAGDPDDPRPARCGRGPAASQRARPPAHRLPVPRPARGGGPADRAPARSGAVQPAADPLAEFGWLATKGTAWVVRRSTDLVPGLLAMAIRERCSGS